MARSLAVSAIIGVFLFISACSKTTDVEPLESGYAYFPLEIGQFTIYDLTDTVFSLASVPIGEHYQVKEVIKDTFTDIEGQKTYRIERFARPGVGSGWVLDSVWTARRTVDRAIRVENNLAFVKLIFPTREGVKWNGNAYNNLDTTNGNTESRLYRMNNIGKKMTLDGLTYDETLVVLQSSDTSANLINQDKRYEVYAKGIGLIYQEKKIIQFCSEEECLGQGKIDYGTKRVQKIIGYGKE